MSTNHDGANKLGAILQEIASNASTSFKTSSYRFKKSSSPSTDDDEYDGPLTDELFNIVHGKLSLPALQNALKKSRKREIQGAKLAEKLTERSRRLSHIVRLHEILEENREILKTYKNSKLLPPWLTKDSRYYELKEVIECLESELKQKHKIEKNADVEKKVTAFEPKKSMIKKLKKLVKNQSYIKKLLFSAIKTVSKKFKARVLEKHPELELWVSFLSCEQVKKLVKLKEDYNFTATRFNDFAREIKTVKKQLNNAKGFEKKHLTKELELLQLVSNEAHQNITHEHRYNTYLLPDAEKEQRRHRDFGFGRDL